MASEVFRFGRATGTMRRDSGTRTHDTYLSGARMPVSHRAIPGRPAGSLAAPPGPRDHAPDPSSGFGVSPSVALSRKELTA